MKKDDIQFPNEFVAILDKDGDVVDFCLPNDDVIQSLRRLLDGENPEDVPHTAWIWNDGWKSGIEVEFLLGGE